MSRTVNRIIVVRQWETVGDSGRWGNKVSGGRSSKGNDKGIGGFDSL